MAGSADAFPAADAEKELNPGQNKDFEVDSVSSQLAKFNQNKEQGDGTKRKNENDSMQTLKTTVIVSGAVVAVAAAIFAITKKFRET